MSLDGTEITLAIGARPGWRGSRTNTPGAAAYTWAPGPDWTVVEVFRVPQDSCLVRIDGDPNRRREMNQALKKRAEQSRSLD